MDDEIEEQLDAQPAVSDESSTVTEAADLEAIDAQLDRATAVLDEVEARLAELDGESPE